MAIKTVDEIYESLKANLEDRIGDSIQTGSVIDMFNRTVSDEINLMYSHIEENKNPHLFTNTFGEDLDSLGYWPGISREENETDESYKYRLKDWVLSSEASNTTAIENKLITPKVANSIQYVPYTHGSGTGTCYVIPKTYSNEDIMESLKEANELLEDVISPSLYVEYVVPAIRGIKLQCFLSTTGDNGNIKNNISLKVKEYVNGIAPGTYLQISEIIKIGLTEPGVKYFNVIAFYLNEEVYEEIEVIQELETKFIFDTILWSDEV